VEVRSDSDVQIDRQTWVYGRKTNRTSDLLNDINVDCIKNVMTSSAKLLLASLCFVT